jgi:hypothetical protein
MQDSPMQIAYQNQVASPTFKAGTVGGSVGSYTPPPANAGANTQNFLESVLPGIGNLTSSTTGVIGNLLNGLPSASQARTTNAYWGVGAGQPAGGAGGGGIDTFIGQRGTDLYGQQAQQNQQTGLSDLMQTIGTYTSPALQNQGQQLQNQQFGKQLSQQGSQFDQNYKLSEFNAMLAALGLGNNITGQLPGNIIV